MTKEEEYRKKIRAILIRFQIDPKMTVRETADAIIDLLVEVELPEVDQIIEVEL